MEANLLSADSTICVASRVLDRCARQLLEFFVPVLDRAYAYHTGLRGNLWPERVLASFAFSPAAILVDQICEGLEFQVDLLPKRRSPPVHVPFAIVV